MSMFTAFGHILGRPLSWVTAVAQPTSRSNMEGHAPNPVGSGNDVVEPFEPGILDVLVVKAMLNKAFALPPELLDTIFDLADYWPHSSTQWSGGPLQIYGGRADREDVFLVSARLFSVTVMVTC